MNTMCGCTYGGIQMEKAEKIKELRESTGMNRKEFCEFFQIPYRTVSEWERDGRHAPDYVIRLLEYYIRMGGLMKNGPKRVEFDTFKGAERKDG